MRQTYIGAISGHEPDLGIVFRDFPGCASAGESITEALAMGRAFVIGAARRELARLQTSA